MEKQLKKYIGISVVLLLSACVEQQVNSTVKKIDMDTVIETKQLAEEAYENKAWEQVIIYNRKLIEVLPAEPELYFKLANAYAYLQQHGRAERGYKESLMRDKENAKVWHNLGITQIRLAAMTFLEMQDYVDDKDPLSMRAKVLLKKLSEILDEDFLDANSKH